MDSSIVTESISDAWTRTRTLLLTERDIGRWLKYGFIAMLGATAMRGSAWLNYSPPVGSPSGGGKWGGPSSRIGSEAADAIRAALEWLAANIANLLILAVGLVTVWVVAWLLLLYIRSVFRFIFVEAVAAPREPGVIPSFHRHTGRGLSLLLWNFVLGLIPLALVVIALIPIVSSFGLLASGKPLGAILGVGGIFGLMGLIVFALLLLAMGRGLTEDFLVPAMYARGCGVIEGWRHVARAWQGALGNIILFYLLKFALAIGAGIVAAIVGAVSVLLLIIPAISMLGIAGVIALSGLAPQTALMIFGGPALIAALLGAGAYGYLVSVLLLPVSVFFQAYSLAFIGRLDESLRTI